MNEQNFNEAIKRMQEMSSRSVYKPPPPQKPPAPPKENGLFSLPFLDKLKTDGDFALILGLLLLLLSEKADKRLLFALIYILL